MPEYRAIPIGIENFKEMTDKEYYFIDKTLMIKDLLDNKGKVNLFTRPRRFGKTLNMSMLRYFFEKSDKDNSYLFEGLNISKAGDKYMACQEQYPVIQLSLKGMKQPSFEDSYFVFQTIIINEFERHRDAVEQCKIKGDERNQYEMICDRTASKTAYATSLKFLSDCLKKVYNKNVIILIDEYDVPLENAYFEGFYTDMVKLIRSLFESALKTNDSLEFAVLTGCLRVSKESIFTGLNNLNVFSVTDYSFSQYFGFTEEEVKAITDYYNISDCFDEMKRWYDGYKFGKSEIYNPWSVLNYIRNAVNNEENYPKPYWVNTSSNSIIHELIVKSDRQIRDDIEKLVGGKTIDKPLYEDITYANMNVKSEYIWSFLLHTGYLKINSIYSSADQIYFRAVIPNTEVRTIYENTFRHWFDESIKESDRGIFFNAVINGDAEVFTGEINRWLMKSISYHDGYENFYHGFLVGLLQYTDDYLVESNRESGTGRNDIIVKDTINYKKAVIIEIKTVKDGETLVGQCDKALKQIEERNYQASLENEGYTDFIKYGISFMGKRCMVKKA